MRKITISEAMLRKALRDFNVDLANDAANLVPDRLASLELDGDRTIVIVLTAKGLQDAFDMIVSEAARELEVTS